MLRFTAVIILLVAYADAQKSCASLVRYGKESAGGEGIVTIHAPKISNHELKVKFTLDSRLRSTYAGDIGLTKSAEEAVKDIRHGSPLNYRIKFPPGSQTPKIVSVNYNNEELCDEKADSFQTLVTLTHQLDTGVRLENEVNNYDEDTPRSVIPPAPQKIQPIPPVARVASPTKQPIEQPKNILNIKPTELKGNVKPTTAELKGSDIIQKLVNGQFKPLAVFNTQDLLEKDQGKEYGVQDYNQFTGNRHRPPYVSPHHNTHQTGHKKDVDLTLRIPGQYIENAVVAIVISVADAYDGQGQVVYQNVLNKS